MRAQRRGFQTSRDVLKPAGEHRDDRKNAPVSTSRSAEHAVEARHSMLLDIKLTDVEDDAMFERR